MKYTLGSPRAMSAEPSLDPPDELPVCCVCEVTRTNKFTDVCAKCRDEEQEEEEQDL